MARFRPWLHCAGLALGCGAIALGGDAWPRAVLSTPGDVGFEPQSVVVVTMGDGRIIAVGETEVRVADWALCVADGVCFEPRDFPSRDRNAPMTDVNWIDVGVYLSWLVETTGHAWRLPTKEEWLAFAAEAAPQPKRPLFDDPRLAWAADYDVTATPRSSRPRPTGEFGRNRLGVADLTGNVWEWTSTCWNGLDRSRPTNCGGVRIAMGEHEAKLSELTREPSKSGCAAGSPPAAVGFRVVRSVDG